MTDDLSVCPTCGALPCDWTDPPTAKAALAMTAARECVDKVEDWWKPDPEDPFWMLEAKDGEWLKNKHSLLGTRDPAKAIRFPTMQDAYDHPARMTAGCKWWTAKPTEHLWVKFPPALSTRSQSPDVEAMRELLARWIRLADSGHFRDTTHLSLAAHPLADDTRETLETHND